MKTNHDLSFSKVAEFNNAGERERESEGRRRGEVRGGEGKREEEERGGRGERLSSLSNFNIRLLN